MRDRAKIISRIKDLAKSNDIYIPTREELEIYNEIYRNKRLKRKEENMAKKQVDGIKNEERVKVIVNSIDQDETEEFFSINDYVARIKFGEVVNIPKSLVKLIKNAKEFIHSKADDGTIKKRVISKYHIEYV